jgi:hypothetical protein
MRLGRADGQSLSRRSPARQSWRACCAQAFGVALAIAAIVAPGLARAGGSCNFGDFLQAVENTVSSLSSGACGAACAEGGAGCFAAGGIGTALGVVAATQGQGSVDNFCTALNTAASDATSIQSWLAAAGVGSDLVSAIASAGDPISVAQCACDLEQNVGQLSSEASSCFQDAICGLQQDLGFGGCSCTPPAPVAVACSQIVGDNSSPAPTRVDKLTNGTLVTDLRQGWDGHSQYCSPQQYCFCPSPMQVVEQPDYALLGSDPWPCQSQTDYYCAWTYSCQCPQLGPGQTTHPAAASGPLSQVCLCDSTGLAAVPPVKSNINPTGSICPIPLTGIPCPNGQVRDGQGKCVAACASGSQVMTPDGHCCDPTQVTSCGTCCPPGTTPNLTNGTCSPNQTTQ